MDEPPSRSTGKRRKDNQRRNRNDDEPDNHDEHNGNHQNGDNDDPNDEFENGTANLHESMEKLTQKRRTTREEGLNELIEGLGGKYCYNFVSARVDTFTEIIKYSMKTGTLKERISACKLASILIITLGAEKDSLRMYEDIYTPLKEIIVDPKQEESLQAACLEMLGIGCFIAVEDPERSTTIMELFSNFFKNNTATQSVDAALGAWTLLCTVTDTDTETLLVDNFPAITRLVQHSNIDVNITAAEAIGVLSSILISQNPEDEFDAKVFDGYCDDWANAEDQLHAIVNNKQSTKKDKRRTNVVKEVLITLETGKQPEDSFTFKKQKFSFNTWIKRVQLDAMRNTLEQGFQDHFCRNPLLHDIFDIRFDETAEKYTMSSAEKRFYMSPNSAVSKARTQGREKEQHNKIAYKNFWQDND